jgi:hypothetical protein
MRTHTCPTSTTATSTHSCLIRSGIESGERCLRTATVRRLGGPAADVVVGVQHRLFGSATTSEKPNTRSTLSFVRLEDVDGMRRSLAIGGSLTRTDTARLLDACQALLEQREAIAAVLSQLGPSWRDTRAALNELARIVRQA